MGGGGRAGAPNRRQSPPLAARHQSELLFTDGEAGILYGGKKYTGKITEAGLVWSDGENGMAHVWKRPGQWRSFSVGGHAMLKHNIQIESEGFTIRAGALLQVLNVSGKTDGSVCTVHVDRRYIPTTHPIYGMTDEELTLEMQPDWVKPFTGTEGLVVEKKPFEKLGAVWRGTTTKLKKVKEGLLKNAGGEVFLGWTVTHVNGMKVGGADEIARIALPAEKVTLAFTPDQIPEAMRPR